MRVTLRLADGLSSGEGQLKVATLGRRPFIVGRSPDADWSLTDPTNQISGVHFELRTQGDDLLLTDLSSGGTALGSSRNRLHREQPTRLEEDTTLFLPVGTIQLSIERDGGATRRLPEADDGRDFFEINEIQKERGMAPPEERPRPADPDRLLRDEPLHRSGAESLDDPFDGVDIARPLGSGGGGGGGGGGGAKLLDPGALLGGGGGEVAPSRPAARSGFDDVRSAEPQAPIARDPLDSEPVSRSEPRPAPSRLPDADDLLGGGTEKPMGGVAPQHEFPDGHKAGASWLDDDEDDLFQEPSRSEPEPEPEPEPMQAEPDPRLADVAEPETRPTEPAPVPAVAPTAAQGTPVPPAENQVGPTPGAAQAETALQALFAELGVPLDGDPQTNAELCAEIGRTYVAMADAMRRMLETRAEVKRALGIVATEVELGANPLKTARDSTAAVDGLIRPLSSGFLSGEAAVEDTLESMQAHQYALVSGIKAALNKTLAEFDPETLEKRLTKRGMSSWLPGQRKAALWDAFTQNYDRFSEQAHENFRMLVGRELDSLYHRHRHGPGTGRRDHD